MSEKVLILKLCQLVLALCFISPTIVSQQSPEMKNVGSIKNSKTTSYYFLSQNSLNWNNAVSECKSFLGDTANLLSIETETELEEVTKFLEDQDDTGSSYWTSGRYDDEKEAFVWDNGVEFGNWVPWDLGNPNTKLTITRVSLHRSGPLKIRTQFVTDSLRYMCELQV